MAVIVPLLLAVLALSGPALAHGGLANYTVGDTWYRGYDPDTPAGEQLGRPWLVQRPWASIDPIFSVDDKFLACNKPGTPAVAYMPIRAGEDITAVYWYWLHPVGPMTVWLAQCGGSDTTQDLCSAVDVNEAEWFKIWEAGLIGDDIPNLAEAMWYQKQFQNWDGSPDLWPVTIPASLRPGLYMIRHEILSIHIEDKPQFYPECGYLNVTGTGAAFPPRDMLKKFPGAYDANDPSIKIDIYASNATTYIIPGGPVWNG
ncbi:glycoside hydrolase family 61 protein [Lasiosphaeria miniovina]|uniref:lytic cellulose monooxygenase (C4-dehydrogenating) n=1 Tax=Lasiosphaeria miniovina TaxID=1954250 RepID=A0AA40ABX8_9PEZI|nr:glycoside hydrolase family 61 protein [Lasiosphaeria miniovina]KAK0712843.1 glycoside hydrolase family 61 protein [Lasiosphaeria miniovina]